MGLCGERRESYYHAAQSVLSGYICAHAMHSCHACKPYTHATHAPPLQDPSHPRPPSLGPPRPSLAATRLYLRALIGAGIKGIAAHAPPHAVPWVRHNRAREAIALYADLEARRGGDPAQGVSALVEELAAQVSANLALTEDERLTLVGAAEWAMAEHGAAPSAAARVCLAECLLRAAKAAEALAWLAGAAHPSPPEWAAVRLAQVASLALAELAAQGTPLREVLAWARRMASAGVHPSPHALHALATTACDARDSNAALVATRALLASVAAFADRRGRVHVLPARASPALCESLLGVAAALGHAALAEAAWELAVRSLHVPTPPAHWRPLTLCRMPGDGGRGAESGLWERTGLPGRGAGWRPGAVLEGARRKGGAQRRLAILRAREVARAAALARLAESGWSAGAGVVEDDRRGLASEAEWGEGEQAWAHRRRINAMIARELVRGHWGCCVCEEAGEGVGDDGCVRELVRHRRFAQARGLSWCEAWILWSLSSEPKSTAVFAELCGIGPRRRGDAKQWGYGRAEHTYPAWHSNRGRWGRGWRGWPD